MSGYDVVVITSNILPGLIKAGIDCIEHGEGTSPILSSYEDAARTYALTWAIREASERTMRPRP